LHEFGTVEQVLANVEQLKGKLKEKMEQHAADARLSKHLATIERQMPLTLTLEQLRFAGLNQQSTIEMFKRLEFKSLIEKVSSTFDLDMETTSFESTTQESTTQELTPLQLTVVDSADAWRQLLQTLPEILSIHVESAGDHPHQSTLLGIAMASQDRQFFVPATYLTPTLDNAEELRVLREWMGNSGHTKSVYDVNRTTVVLGWNEISLAGANFDASLAAYVLNPTETRHALHELAVQYELESIRSDDEVYGKGAKYRLPELDHIADHVARKARTVLQLREKMENELVQSDMVDLMNEMELPVSSLLAQMELTGVGVDVEQLRAYGQQLIGQIELLVTRIYEQAGMEFNINSTKQLADVLFEKLALPPGKKTKSGYSTDAEELERLAFHSQIVRDLLHYRQLTKLNSTYVEGLLKEIHVRTGKVHTYFNQTTTATGRLSSQYPNLQNIPIRLEEGRLIRKVFIPSEAGWSILAADYSQIELRVLAHISQDERLIEAFQKNMDIHTKTAMDVFGVSEDAVDANMRRQAKAVNFGIVYGISDYGLSQNLGITRKQAAQFIEQYFAVFSGVKQYMEDIVKQAKHDGYVSTLLKRRRYLPDIRSSNFNVRSFAERTAMNTPIQGTAADIIKLAMVDMAVHMKNRGVRSRLLLQVHDELVFEVPADEVELMSKLVPQVMEQAIKLSVPLKADLSVGSNWYEAK
jgi:DNA polymerase-1